MNKERGWQHQPLSLLYALNLLHLFIYLLNKSVTCCFTKSFLNKRYC